MGWWARFALRTLRSAHSYRQLRAAHQRPEGLERGPLPERLQHGEKPRRRLLAHRVRGAVHELPLDLLARERELRRAAGVVAQLLDLAAVAERDGDARGTVLEDVGELRIDRDRDEARGGAHLLVADRFLGEGGE